MRHSKPVIGICGGIGAGKSQVAAEFGAQGCEVISSDRLNHEVLAEPEVVSQLRQWWGPGVVDVSGRVDRPRVGEIVFSNPSEKRRLESLVHPLIARRREAIIRASEDNPALKAIVIDSPLLFESNLDRECDAVVFVDADYSRRLHRLQTERGWAADELDRREATQMPLSVKRQRADYVIDNDGPAAYLRPQVADILGRIVAQYGRTE